MKIYKAFISVLIFFVLLILIYWVDISYFKVDVLLYSAIRDGFLAAIIACCILHLPWFFTVLNMFERAQLSIIMFLCAYIYAISIPTVIDRSLSFYVLEKIQQRGGGIKLDSFKEIFTNEYVKEHHLMEIRLTEQQQSGTVFIDNGCVKLTKIGEQTAAFSRFFRKHFLPKKRLINGVYSDALVDPFKNSITAPDYTCN